MFSFYYFDTRAVEKSDLFGTCFWDVVIISVVAFFVGSDANAVIFVVASVVFIIAVVVVVVIIAIVVVVVIAIVVIDFIAVVVFFMAIAVIFITAVLLHNFRLID